MDLFIERDAIDTRASLLIFVVIMLTAIVRPYNVQLLQQIEISCLSALIGTVWVAGVFSKYPHCEEKGLTIAWCEILSLIIASANILVIIAVGVVYLRGIKGARHLERCLHRMRTLSCCTASVSGLHRSAQPSNVEQVGENNQVTMYENPALDIELQKLY